MVKILAYVILTVMLFVSIYLIPKEIEEWKILSEDELQERLSKFDFLVDAQVHANIEKEFKDEKRACLYRLTRTLILGFISLFALILFVIDTLLKGY